MAFQKGNTYGKKGRPKGSKNKLTEVRNKFIKVFNKLGGEEALLKFIEENKIAKREFFLKVIPGMLPRVTELEGDVGGKVLFILDGDEQDNKTTADATEIHT